MKDLKSLLSEKLGSEAASKALKVFTLPTCPSCPLAKMMASEVAQKFGIAFREVNMATEEGLKEGLACDIRSTPSITIEGEVIVRGRLISKERLEEEVEKRLEKWKARASE